MLGSEPELEQTLGGKHREGALRAGRSRLPSRTVAGAEEPDENKEGKCGQSRGEKVFVGVDVSKKILDVYFRPLGERLRVENSPAGHAQLAERCKALNVEVIVFESTGGYERDATHTLLDAGFKVAVSNAAQVRYFGKDAEEQVAADLLVRRRQLVEMRTMEKTRLHQARPDVRPGLLEHIGWLNKEIKRVENDIDDFLRGHFKEEEELLSSVPGFGAVSKRTLLLALPELGQLNRREVAALVGLAPFNVDSGEQRGQRHIRGGRGEVRSVLFMAALAAVRKKETYFGDLYRRMKSNGKPAKVALVAVTRKLLVMANAVLRTKTPWVQPA
jgi:transposase